MARNTQVFQQSKNVLVKIPITGNGRWQCKEYVGNIEGKAIATQSTNILTSHIVEWQITYFDKNKTFFELSDIMQKLKNLNILQQNTIDAMITEISNINNFLTDKPEFDFVDEIDEYGFSVGSLKQPVRRKTYLSGIKIDVINRRQQKGKNAQPMVFLLIPISAFNNNASITNVYANSKTYGELIFDENNLDIVIDLAKTFGRCSVSHKTDILYILKNL